MDLMSFPRGLVIKKLKRFLFFSNVLVEGIKLRGRMPLTHGKVAHMCILLITAMFDSITLSLDSFLIQVSMTSV